MSENEKKFGIDMTKFIQAQNTQSLNRELLSSIQNGSYNSEMSMDK